MIKVAIINKYDKELFYKVKQQTLKNPIGIELPNS